MSWIIVPPKARFAQICLPISPCSTRRELSNDIFTRTRLDSTLELRHDNPKQKYIILFILKNKISKKNVFCLCFIKCFYSTRKIILFVFTKPHAMILSIFLGCPPPESTFSVQSQLTSWSALALGPPVMAWDLAMHGTQPMTSIHNPCLNLNRSLGRKGHLFLSLLIVFLFL